MKTKTKTTARAQKAQTARKSPGMKATSGTLTVTGEGQIKVRPDTAIIDMSVVSTAKTAQEAVTQNAGRMTSVTAALKVLGLPQTDLQTVGYDVFPIIDNDEKSPTFGKALQYRVISTLRARVDIDSAGELIDAGMRAGADVTSGMRLAVRDEPGVRARALKAAVKAAHRDADTVADSMAIKLHGVANAEVTMGGRPVLYRDVAMLAKGGVPIEPGTVDVSASVRVTYRTM